jgi:hypothetical protein
VASGQSAVSNPQKDRTATTSCRLRASSQSLSQNFLRDSFRLRLRRDSSLRGFPGQAYGAANRINDLRVEIYV